MTHALRGLGIEPVAYCERDPSAIAILRYRMRSGHLPPAPLHTDVAKFPGKQFQGNIDIIIGGFPCVGFSTTGLQQGFNNPGSGLYKHVIRLVTEIQPSFVFLENVHSIRIQGLPHVAETLRARGYDVSWVTLKAFQVGSPQYRPRWFCLAVKRGTPPQTLKLAKNSFTPFDWRREPVRRLIPDNTNVRRRMELLGNAVVPDCVRAAFLYLWTGSQLPLCDLLKMPVLKLAVPNGKGRLPTPPGDPPANGLALGRNSIGALPPPTGVQTLSPSRKITVDAHTYDWAGPRNPTQTLERLAAPSTMLCWATPRRSCPLAARVLTERTTRDLPSQLRFEVKTPDDQRDGHPNPQFVEWLMGLPRDWTKFA
jgi:hypothetical protein